MRPAILAVLCAAALAAQPVSVEWLKSLAGQLRGGNAAAMRVELQQSLESARARGDRRQEAYLHAGLALVAELGGQAAAADTEFNAAVQAAAQAGDSAFTASAALAIAQERLRLANTSRAGVWAGIAEKEFRAAHDSSNLAWALLLKARAAGFGAQRYALLQEAVAAAKESGDARRLATIRIDWGDALRLAGDFASAIEELRSATEILEQIGDWSEAGRALSALGRTYMVHGMERESMAALERSRALYERAGEAAGAMTTLVTIGVLQSLTGHHEEALESLDRVRAYAQDPGTPLSVRLRMAGLAYGYLQIGEFARAAALVERLIEEYPQRTPQASYWILSRAYFSLGRYRESVDIAAAGLARTGPDQVFPRLWSYRWRARSLDKLNRFEEAAHDMREAVRLANTIHGNLAPEDEFRRAHGAAQEDLASDAVAVLWRAGRKTEALEAAEQFRARAFLDLMASRTAGNERNVFSDPPSPDKLAAYAKRAHRALLSYWVHPEAVYIWLVDGEGHIHSARTAIAESRVKLLAERARKFSYTPDREAWRSLHRLLIQPLEAWLPKGDDQSLTLLPHGALLQLPFAALLDPAGRYLGEKYILRVAPAAGFLVREAAPPAGAGELVLVGASRSAGLPALPGARRELEMVAALSPGSRLLSGEAAQEAQVRAAAQRARVLHFATHAIVDEGAPFESYLALSGSQKLTAAEIYNLRLHADLVVLSACRSGSGKVSADGLVGFTRAFLYAGAASVLAPLWDIPDEPTVRLVEEFYRQYRGGANKAQALRAAQLKLLAELRSGKFTVATPAGPMSLPEHPAIWAGFVIQGDE